MSNSNNKYEINATMPMQVSKGKIEDGPDNSDAQLEDPKTRNGRYGYIEIKTEATVGKESKPKSAAYKEEEGQPKQPKEKEETR